jgi:MraZ protein
MLTWWEGVVKFPIDFRLDGIDSMLLLTGEYAHTLDGKGRLFISNKLRSQIDAEQHGANFYLVMGANGVLCLYPEKYFQQIALAVAPGTVAPDEAVAFERMSFALASKVELDRQGRLLLNEKLRMRAGLKNDITLVGIRDHIELWNSDAWEKYLADHLAQYQQQALQARQSVLQRQSQQLEM